MVLLHQYKLQNSMVQYGTVQKKGKCKQVPHHTKPFHSMISQSTSVVVLSRYRKTPVLSSMGVSCLLSGVLLRSYQGVQSKQRQLNDELN